MLNKILNRLGEATTWLGLASFTAGARDFFGPLFPSAGELDQAAAAAAGVASAVSAGQPWYVALVLVVGGVVGMARKETGAIE